MSKVYMNNIDTSNYIYVCIIGEYVSISDEMLDFKPGVFL